MKSANNEIGTSVTKDRKVRSFKSLSTILISFDFSLVFSFKAFYLICFLYTYFNWPSKAADLHQLQQRMRIHTHTHSRLLLLLLSAIWFGSFRSNSFKCQWRRQEPYCGDDQFTIYTHISLYIRVCFVSFNFDCLTGWSGLFSILIGNIFFEAYFFIRLYS